MAQRYSSDEDSSSSDDEEVLHRKSYESKVSSLKTKVISKSASTASNEPSTYDRNQLIEMQAALKASSIRGAASANEVGRLRVECEKLRRLSENGKDVASALASSKEETANARRRAAEACFSADRLREQLETSREREKNLSMRVNELRRLETSLSTVEKGFKLHKENGMICVAQASTELLKLEKYLLLGLTSQNTSNNKSSEISKLQLMLGSEGCDILEKCSNAIRNLENLFSNSPTMNAMNEKSLKELSMTSQSIDSIGCSDRGELRREYERVVRQLRSDIEKNKIEINCLSTQVHEAHLRSRSKDAEVMKLREHTIRSEERCKALEFNYTEAKQRLLGLEETLKDNHIKISHLEMTLKKEQSDKEQGLKRIHQLSSEIEPLNESLKEKNDRVLLLVRENTKLVKSRAELQQAASDAVEIAMKASDAAKQLGKKYSKAEKERSEMNTLNKELSSQLSSMEEAKLELETYISQLKKERDHLRELHLRLADPYDRAQYDHPPQYNHPPPQYDQHSHHMRQREEYRAYPQSDHHSSGFIDYSSQTDNRKLESYLFSRKQSRHSSVTQAPVQPPSMPNRTNTPVTIGGNHRTSVKEEDKVRRSFEQAKEDENIQVMLNEDEVKIGEGCRSDESINHPPNPLLAYLSPTPSRHETPPVEANREDAGLKDGRSPSVAPSPTPSITSSEGCRRQALLEQDMAELDMEINGLRKALEEAAKKTTHSILTQVANGSAATGGV